MTKVHTSKSGKTITGPSFFVNPQQHLDAKSLLIAEMEHGLPNIDGLLINIGDHKTVSDNLGFNSRPLVQEERPTIRDKVRLIDPALHQLLSGSSVQKERILDTKLFSRQLNRTLFGLADSDLSNTEKARKIIDEVYPHLVVKPLLEFEARNGADGLISPCIGLSSQKYLRQQMTKARQMLTDTRTLLETSSLKSYLETRDLINVLTINYQLIQESNFHMLSDLALCNNPDQVGFRIMGLREADTVGQKLVFDFLRNFATYSMMTQEHRKEPIPIHLINVDELGYVGYCNAVFNIVCPIATSPYFAFRGKRKSGNEGDIEERDLSPTYYHPYDMNQPKMKSLDLLPCFCGECKKYNRVSNVSKEHIPIFRRVHWLNCKNEEIRQLRETPARLDIALRDKLANSMRTQLIAYIPAEPLFTVY